LSDHLKGAALVAPTPKQTVLAEMVQNADPELWKRLSAGSRNAWKQTEAANVIRDLHSDELEAAVGIGATWSNDKAWDSDIVSRIPHTTGKGDAVARRIMKRLVDIGFIEEAGDLDYSKQPERAWSDGDILWILSSVARRSGLSPALPPPLPERLSSFLAYERPVTINASVWYAVRFVKPFLSAFSENETVIAAVGRSAEPARTWAFRSRDDLDPLAAKHYLSLTALMPAAPLAKSGAEREKSDHVRLGFNLTTFNDLNLLRT
jgi:hypothetical protein